MDATTTRQTATEVGKVLDALAALSYDIECHCANLPDDAKVLTALRGRETCAAIREAVTALKKILLITEQHGGGLLPNEIGQHIDDAA